jgi:Holliday junction resolvasome RuvABC DNA-binding subunit
MSKELKVDERILRDQIIRKSAVDNMTNIAKQRSDLKQGITPIAPVNKSATDIAEDRTTQASEAVQNLIDLGFSGRDAQDIANTLPHQERVAFNRAYPQIKTDFNSRFSIRNTTPAFFIEYLNKYLEVLTASSGVPSNLGYLKDNLITNPNDLLKLIITSEMVSSLQNDLRNGRPAMVGTPLDLLLTNLIAELPNSNTIMSLNLAMTGDPVMGYKAIQVILDAMKSLPNGDTIKKIVMSTSSSAPQKIATLLAKLGTLTPTDIAELQAVRTFLLNHFPVVATTAPSAVVSGMASPAVQTFISDIQAINPNLLPSAVGKTFAGATANCVPLETVDGVQFYVFSYSSGGTRYFGVLVETSSAPPTGDIVRDRINYNHIKDFIRTLGLGNQFAVGYANYRNSGPFPATAGIFEDYVNTGSPISVNSRMAGAGINGGKLSKSSKKQSTVKHHTGLKAIKLGKGFENRDDPYTMYNEELKLTPIRQEDIIKKSPKKQVHAVVEGVEGDEYQKFDDKTNRYIAFGKYAINMRQLKKSVLQIVYKSLAPNPSFPSKKISSELQQYLFELLTNKKSLPALYKHVTEDEKKMFEKLAIFAGVFDKLNLPRINSLEDEKKEMDRFKLLHGEFVAGNDNVGIARELRNLILKFLAENRISKAKAYEYMLELNNA